MIRKPSRNNPRKSDAYRDFRRQVLKRDKYRCQMPGCKKRSRLEVHHIIRYADSVHGRLDTSNAISLCRTCHKDVTGGETHWIMLFSKIVSENERKKK
jgi:5-methylcytosine-specific restriction endonuclease McrA